MPIVREKHISTKQNMLWNAAGSLFFLGCLWLITVLVVRLSNGYDAAGVLALGMAVSNIGVPLAQYKIRAYQVSDIEHEFSPGLYVGHRFVTMALAFVIMVVYGSLTCAAETLPAVLLYCLYSLVAVFSDVFQGIEQQHDRMDIVGISYFLRGAATLGGFVISMLLTGSLVVSFIAMTVLCVLCVVLYELPCVRFLEPHFSLSFDKTQLARLFTICLPAVIASLFASAIPSIPRQILGAVAGTAVLGGYASIAAPVLIIQMGATYVYAPLLKNIAELSASGNTRGFTGLLLKAALAMLGIAVAASLVLIFAASPLFTLLYGEGVTEYLVFLYPLILCTVLTALSWFLGDVLIAIRDLRGNLIAFAVAFALSAVLAYPLICFAGGNGVSFAISLGMACAVVIALARIFAHCKNAEHAATHASAACREDREPLGSTSSHAGNAQTDEARINEKVHAKTEVVQTEDVQTEVVQTEAAQAKVVQTEEVQAKKVQAKEVHS